MVGVFDTAFNQTMEPKAFSLRPSLPVLREVQNTPLRDSTESAIDMFPGERLEFMRQDLKRVKTIVCHLGNGASICAGKNMDRSWTIPWDLLRWRGSSWEPDAGT